MNFISLYFYFIQIPYFNYKKYDKHWSAESAPLQENR